MQFIDICLWYRSFFLSGIITYNCFFMSTLREIQMKVSNITSSIIPVDAVGNTYKTIAYMNYRALRKYHEWGSEHFIELPYMEYVFYSITLWKIGFTVAVYSRWNIIWKNYEKRQKAKTVWVILISIGVQQYSQKRIEYTIISSTIFYRWVFGRHWILFAYHWH